MQHGAWARTCVARARGVSRVWGRSEPCQATIAAATEAAGGWAGVDGLLEEGQHPNSTVDVGELVAEALVDLVNPRARQVGEAAFGDDDGGRRRGARWRRRWLWRRTNAGDREEEPQQLSSERLHGGAAAP